jgi:hypothetical protein
LAAGLIEPTIPDKPNSSLQPYQLTAKGRPSGIFIAAGDWTVYWTFTGLLTGLDRDWTFRLDCKIAT